MTYSSSGHAYLVCPALLELDERHARHPTRRPNCARGLQCVREHDHEPVLADPAGHRVVDFYWLAGADSIEAHYACAEGCHDDLRCDCGRQLVYADLDDPRRPGDGA